MALISKENICFIKDEAPEFAKIKLACVASLLEVVREFTERGHHDVVAICDTRLREVGHSDVRVLTELLVNIGDLGRELTNMSNNQDLTLHD